MFHKFIIFTSLLLSCSQLSLGQVQKSIGLQRFLNLWQGNWDTQLSHDDFNISFDYQPIEGLGFEKGIGRRDPSSIILVDGTYYLWYSRIETLEPPVGFEHATKEKRAVTWDLATIWYATSKDGIKWQEQGEAIPLGPDGEFDDRSVFTADILVSDGKYYLYYQAVSYPYTQKTQNVIAMSWAESPDGPWHRFPKPILKTGDPGEWVPEKEVKVQENFGWPITKKSAWDGLKIHDPTVIVRDGKFYLYYKGHPFGESMKWPAGRRRADKYYGLPIAHGVAIANSPEGPFVKSPLNPILAGGHECTYWPHGTGVACLMIQGPEAGTIQFAQDGVNFYTMSLVGNYPEAAGVFRPNQFKDILDYPGEGISWGVSHILKYGQDNWWPFLMRFDCKPVNRIKEVYKPK